MFSRKGIRNALQQFAEDEGNVACVEVAEKWHCILEELAEVADVEQLAHILPILEAVE